MQLKLLLAHVHTFCMYVKLIKKRVYAKALCTLAYFHRPCTRLQVWNKPVQQSVVQLVESSFYILGLTYDFIKNFEVHITTNLW